MRRVYLVFALNIIVYSTACAAATNQEVDLEIAAHETRLQTIGQQADSLATIEQEIETQADALAEQITRLRGKDTLSRTEHRDLEVYLRESLTLQERSLLVSAQRRRLAREKESVLEQLILLLSQETHQTFLQIEITDGDQKEAATARLQILLSKRDTWLTQFHPQQIRLPEISVTTDPTDSPRQLRIKGDILSDQEDVVRQEIAIVETRIVSLAEEMRIRQKVAELASDLDLFNEREELQGRATYEPNQDSFAEGGRELDDPDAGNLPESSIPNEMIDAPFPESISQNGSLVLPEISEALNGPAPRSPEAIQEWIERLQHHQAWMHARADSLKAQSFWFYRQAEDSAE